MDINATIIGQSIAMIVFVWFCMKFVWPPIIAAMQARADRIADGLAAADRASHDLELRYHNYGGFFRFSYFFDSVGNSNDPERTRLDSDARWRSSVVEGGVVGGERIETGFERGDRERVGEQRIDARALEG